MRFPPGHLVVPHDHAVGIGITRVRVGKIGTVERHRVAGSGIDDIRQSRPEAPHAVGVADGLYDHTPLACKGYPGSNSLVSGTGPLSTINCRPPSQKAIGTCTVTWCPGCRPNSYCPFMNSPM